eukprot:TRINITY_DN48394_c0_g1_i1.p1 TRINITY_DN48394_c0_g1~~TRINITY_DN48394_c0_g1_i1.p1  ORF type:complete len:260 (-),score=25.05 TRINITY_DN48394_c0_g1_i1:46-783(-)
MLPLQYRVASLCTGLSGSRLLTTCGQQSLRAAAACSVRLLKNACQGPGFTTSHPSLVRQNRPISVSRNVLSFGAPQEAIGALLHKKMTQQSRGFAVFGFPPQKATKRYTGMHCHPGMLFGYKNPIKRQGKVKRLPNIRLRSDDFSLSASHDGQFYLRPPYPPRVNRTIEVTPPWGAKENPWPTKVHKSYKMRWRNVEYVYVPQLTRKPHGSASQRWTGPVTRIERLQNGKTSSSLVSHDARILDW